MAFQIPWPLGETNCFQQPVVTALCEGWFSAEECDLWKKGVESEQAESEVFRKWAGREETLRCKGEGGVKEQLKFAGTLCCTFLLGLMFSTRFRRTRAIGVGL